MFLFIQEHNFFLILVGFLGLIYSQKDQQSLFNHFMGNIMCFLKRSKSRNQNHKTYKQVRSVFSILIFSSGYERWKAYFTESWKISLTPELHVASFTASQQSVKEKHAAFLVLLPGVSRLQTVAIIKATVYLPVWAFLLSTILFL